MLPAHLAKAARAAANNLRPPLTVRAAEATHKRLVAAGEAADKLVVELEKKLLAAKAAAAEAHGRCVAAAAADQARARDEEPETKASAIARAIEAAVRKCGAVASDVSTSGEPAAIAATPAAAI